MDPLSALLDPGGQAVDVRVRGTWGVVTAPAPEAVLVALVEGDAWCHQDDGTSVHLLPGDLVLLRPQASGVFSDAETPGRLPATPNYGHAVAGEEVPGGTRMLIRTFSAGPLAASALFDTLAPQHVLTEVRDSPWWVPLRDEADHLSVGRPIMLSRMLDMLLVEGMRRWAAQGEADGWLRAVLDPCVGAALRLIHEHPEYPWTLQELADRVDASRSALSRRFQLFVGESPITYLREWRLTRAATILAEEGAGVAATARRSGFDDPFAFSAAFSKKFGVPPRRYRTQGSSAGCA